MSVQANEKELWFFEMGSGLERVDGVTGPSLGPCVLAGLS